MSLIICHFSLFWILCFGICRLYAQDENKLVALTKQVMDATDKEAIYSQLTDISKIYIGNNQYNECIEFLESLSGQKKQATRTIDYFVALTRYKQMKYLEETQSWDEYFSQGNTYRDQIVLNAKEAIDATSPEDLINVYAHLLLWQFHYDQQDAFVQEALSGLMDSALQYSNSQKNKNETIKEVADKLASYGERRNAKELYKVYVDKVASSDISNEELLDIALGFYKEGNLDLSQSLYDVCIDRINSLGDKEKLFALLKDVVELFAYKDEGKKDPFYAEEVFKRIDELDIGKPLSEDLIYLRAFNLEKAKEYKQAKEAYLNLLKFYPQTSHREEATYKIGMVYLYILQDIQEARSYFKALSVKEGADLSSHVISSLYQLGLVSQWEGNLTDAKGCYDKLISLSNGNFQETVSKAKERLEEIEKSLPIEHNLKTFLDLSLNKESADYTPLQANLTASAYRLDKGQEEVVASNPNMPQTGCMQVELQYLWSGHTGEYKPSLNQDKFDTSYNSVGTKEINLVVTSPSGVVERSMDLVDVY